MLFGTTRQRRDILQAAQDYAKMQDIRLVFGAMVGSVSKGLHYVDSDYDTRFLYLRKDFPEKICIPEEMREDELVMRYYPEGKIFEWIPFWEATSFLQFLIYPSFINDFSVGLYNIVGWTFQSPYVWDPYGLQSKLMPLINKIFWSTYEIDYHKLILDKYASELGNKVVVSKSYMYSVHAAATIDWCINYDEQPPIDLQTLLYGVGQEKVWDEIKKILSDARSISRKNFSYGNTNLHDSHFEITTLHNEILEAYIAKTVLRLSDYTSKKSRDIERDKDIVNSMYQIIYESVFEGEKLLF